MDCFQWKSFNMKLWSLPESHPAGHQKEDFCLLEETKQHDFLNHEFLQHVSWIGPKHGSPLKTCSLKMSWTASLLIHLPKLQARTCQEVIQKGKLNKWNSTSKPLFLGCSVSFGCLGASLQHAVGHVGPWEFRDGRWACTSYTYKNPRLKYVCI